jgi:membrane glycosyltransferase
MLGASTTLRTGIFIIGLAFGHSVVWNGQSRDAHQLTLEEALAGLWPQMIFGGLLFAIAFELAPQLILWSLPLTLGYVLAAPFAVFTSGPAFGAFLKKNGLCAIPEDLSPPPVLTTLESVAAANQTSSSKKD